MPSNRYPWYSPRFWHGMRVGAFLRLMVRNRFKIHILGLGAALFISGTSVFNSILYLFQKLIYGRRIMATTMPKSPLFIIGHWRSGTTMLHELIVRDERFSYANTYQCFAANHFLVSEWCMPRMLWFLLPNRRPMDNMATGFARPQEDDFALCALGAPTPYMRMAFPNEPAPYQDFLNTDLPAPDELSQFRTALDGFLRALSLRSGKRLVLKSPPHTGRVRLLNEMYPDARFVHLVRDPYELFSSTVNLWKTLDRNQGFQLPKYSEEQMQEYVFDSFDTLYQGFNDQHGTLNPEQILELRFEDLIEDPMLCVRRIYDHLDLGDFDEVADSLHEYVQSQKEYRRATHQLNEELKAKIRRRWRWYFERYGYPLDEPQAVRTPDEFANAERES